MRMQAMGFSNNNINLFNETNNNNIDYRMSKKNKERNSPCGYMRPRVFVASVEEPVWRIDVAWMWCSLR